METLNANGPPHEQGSGPMDHKSVLLADRNTIFMLDVEELLRSNGFTNLSVNTIRSIEELKEYMPTFRPDLLVLGDLQSFSSGDKVDQTNDYSINDIMETYSNTFFIDVRNSPNDVGDKPNYKRQSLKKPVNNQELLDLVEEHFLNYPEDEYDKHQ